MGDDPVASKLPEETDHHFRSPDVLRSIRYLGGLVCRTRTAPKGKMAAIMEPLVIMLNDHLRLEGEVIRLAGIVRRHNKLEREKWSSVFPFGERPKPETAKSEAWNRNLSSRSIYMTCEKCRKVKQIAPEEYRTEIVSVDGKPYCKDCLRTMQ